jgi:sulfoxide reductase heme-binding subunit YedZ
VTPLEARTSALATSSKRAKRNAIELTIGALFVLVLLAAVLFARGDGDAYSSGWALTRALGLVAFTGLCATLCVTPISRLARRHRSSAQLTMRLRRAFGLAALSGGLAHAACALTRVPRCPEQLLTSPPLRAGLATLLILSLLGLTSFPALVRKLGLHAWKELHRLAYLALPLALCHALPASFADVRWLAWCAGLTVAIGLLRTLPRRAPSSEQP